MRAADAFAPVGDGPDRAGHKTARAIWANIVEYGVDAVCTEGTFIAANARVVRLCRQIAVTHLAIGS